MPKWLKSSHCKALRGGGHSSNRLLEPFSPCEEKIRHYERQLSNQTNDSVSPCCAAKLFTMTKKAAFTLAETLIAVAILGLLAAIVIPNMFRAYQQYQMVSKLKVAYALLNDVFAQSEAENGPVNTWSTYKSGENETIIDGFFNQYFRPYLKISKDCGRGWGSNSNKCFYSSSRVWSDISGTQLTGGGYVNGDKYYKVILKNGMSLAVKPYQQYASEAMTKRVFVVVDIDGKAGKSILGKDVFIFTIIPENGNNASAANNWKPNYTSREKLGLITGYVPHFTQSANTNSIYNNPTKIMTDNCSKNSSQAGNQNSMNPAGGLCARAIELNGWKVPEGYPR